MIECKETVIQCKVIVIRVGVGDDRNGMLLHLIAFILVMSKSKLKRI